MKYHFIHFDYSWKSSSSEWGRNGSPNARRNAPSTTYFAARYEKICRKFVFEPACVSLDIWLFHIFCILSFSFKSQRILFHQRYILRWRTQPHILFVHPRLLQRRTHKTWTPFHLLWLGYLQWDLRLCMMVNIFFLHRSSDQKGNGIIKIK